MIASQDMDTCVSSFPSDHNVHVVIVEFPTGIIYTVLVRLTDDGDKIVGAYYPYDAETLRRIEFALNDFEEAD